MKASIECNGLNVDVRDTGAEGSFHGRVDTEISVELIEAGGNRDEFFSVRLTNPGKTGHIAAQRLYLSREQLHELMVACSEANRPEGK